MRCVGAQTPFFCTLCTLDATPQSPPYAPGNEICVKGRSSSIRANFGRETDAALDLQDVLAGWCLLVAQPDVLSQWCPHTDAFACLVPPVFVERGMPGLLSDAVQHLIREDVGLLPIHIVASASLNLECLSPLLTLCLTLLHSV